MVSVSGVDHQIQVLTQSLDAAVEEVFHLMAGVH